MLLEALHVKVQCLGCQRRPHGVGGMLILPVLSWRCLPNIGELAFQVALDRIFTTRGRFVDTFKRALLKAKAEEVTEKGTRKTTLHSAFGGKSPSELPMRRMV
ncbi:hypothetical protein ACTXT7_015749 [Hymenolepis weldensis]